MEKITTILAKIKWTQDFNGQKMVIMQDTNNVNVSVYTKKDIVKLLQKDYILLQF